MNSPAGAQERVFSVFSEGENIGNRALVFATSSGSQDDTPLNDRPTNALTINGDNSPQTAATRVLVSKFAVSAVCSVQQGSPGEFDVEWSNAKGPIQFCGHGALAIAAYLDDKNLLEKEIALHFTAGRYQLRKRDGLYWFSSEADPGVSAEKPKNSDGAKTRSLASKLISAKILDSALFLGESGYLLLRLPDDTDLARIQPDLITLQATTARALILTSAQPKHPEFDYSLRYFAPQYGVDEDSATGSANEIAAQFWFTRLSATSLRCHQSSREGGVIYARRENGQIWIGGNVCEDSNFRYTA